MNKEAIELLYKQAQEQGLIFEGEKRMNSDKNLSNITFLETGRAVMTTF